MKNTIPLVSVVIPYYNDPQHINQALDSILQQTYENIEIIIIDDGSDEYSKKKLINYENHVTIVHQLNQGVCVARNNGIRISKADIIVVLDSDDYFEPTFIEKAYGLIENDTNIGMVCSWTNIVDNYGNELYLQKPTGSGVPEVLYHNNSTGSCMFRKSIWQDVGGYDINLTNGYEDWEFNIALSVKGHKVSVISEALFNYRMKETSRNTEAKKYRSEIRRYVFVKYRDIATDNYERTIDFFLNEIQKSEGQTNTIRKSTSFRLGNFLISPYKRFKKVIKF